MKSKKVTVIVPVYNGERFLRECLSRICNQTYHNLEIILVDDGSSDGSLEICREYQREDDRIVVLHKENGGQFSARNMALDIATGDYIGFVDNDDYLEPRFYEVLVELLNTSSASLSRCDDAVLENGILRKNIVSSNQVVSYDEKTFMKQLLTDEIGSHVTDRLFRREVIGEIRFPQSKTIEDMGFMRELVQQRHLTEVYTPEQLYIYNNRDDNTSHMSGRTFVNSYERAIEFQNRLQIARAECADAVDDVLKQATFFSCSSWTKLIRYKKAHKDKRTKMIKFLKENRRAIQANRKIPFYIKVLSFSLGLLSCEA